MFKEYRTWLSFILTTLKCFCTNLWFKDFCKDLYLKHLFVQEMYKTETHLNNGPTALV
jgi:hypothetical protein